MLATLWNLLFAKREIIITADSINAERRKLECLYIKKVRACRSDIHLERISEAYMLGRNSNKMEDIQSSKEALNKL